MEDAPRTPTPAIPPILTTMLVWIGLFGLLAAIHAGAELLGPLFVGINLVIAAWPVRERLLRAGAPRPLATVALGLVVFAVLGLAMFALGWGVSALVRELPDYQSQFTALYNQLVALVATFGITQDQILSQLQSISPSSVAGVASSALSGLSGAASAIAVVAIVIFMLVLDSPSYEARREALARHRPEVSLAIADFIGGVRRYWVVTTVFGLIVALLDVGVLLVAGVPLALVWGIVSFLTNYIPNVGFVIGIIPPVLMALLDRGPASALVVTIAYVVINFVIQSVIQPKFNGDAVGVTALVSFLSLLLWSTVLGPIGALLGLPATLLLKAVLVDHDPHTRWFNAFIASDVATSDPEDADLPEEPEPARDAEDRQNASVDDTSTEAVRG